MARIIPFKNGTRKETIFNKASHLFIEKGYAATSMRSIAGAMGVEAPSLYNHIHSKKEILQEICLRVADRFTAHIRQVEMSDEPCIRKLESIIRFHIRMMMDDFQNVYISEHEWKHLPEPYLSQFKSQRSAYRVRLTGIVEQGIESGELNPVHPSVVALCIFSAAAAIEHWHKSRKAMDAGVLEENMVKVLLKGIEK